jgi:hypothetical protein
MYKQISTAVMVLAFATGGSAAMLGGTASASTGAAHGLATAPAAGHPACTYTIYFWGIPFTVACPANASNGGTATNNCNANCSASATGTKGKSN